MFRFSMRSSSGVFLFISLSMLLILKIIKMFKKCYYSVVVMLQHMLPHNHDGVAMKFIIYCTFPTTKTEMPLV
jgi:hypothetical protein